MGTRRRARATLAVGIDLGGTWARILALDRGRRLRPFTRRAQAGELPSLLRAVWSGRHWRGRVAALVVASRGVWTLGEREALARRLRGLAPTVMVIADAQAALLGALGVRPGLLVLAGTGSIVLGHDGRRWARGGGLGPLLGDEGSAFWLGRRWLQATLADGGDLAARRLATRPDAVAQIAALAPRVIARARRGDRTARSVVRDGQVGLARQALSVARKLGLRPPIAVSWAGGVMANAWYRAGVIRQAAREGLGARWQPPEAEPVAAAAHMAAGLARAPRTRAGPARTTRTSRRRRR